MSVICVDDELQVTSDDLERVFRNLYASVGSGAVIRLPQPVRIAATFGWHTMDSSDAAAMLARPAMSDIRLFERAMRSGTELAQQMQDEVCTVVGHIKLQYARSIPVLVRAIDRGDINGSTYGKCEHAAWGRCAASIDRDVSERCVLGWIASTLNRREREGRCVVQYAQGVLTRTIPHAYALEGYIYDIRPPDTAQNNEKLAFIRDLLIQ